jgi:hypothetical protein
MGGTTDANAEERKIAQAAAAARYAELRDARRAERAEADARSLQLEAEQDRIDKVISLFEPRDQPLLRKYFGGNPIPEVIEATGRMLRQARMYTAPESHLKTLVADFERRYSEQFQAAA